MRMPSIPAHLPSASNVLWGELHLPCAASAHPPWDPTLTPHGTPLAQMRQVLLTEVLATKGDGPPSDQLGGGEAGGSGSSKQRASSELDASLRGLIEGLKLGAAATAEAVRAASVWCEREGVDSAAELVEAEMEADFVAALKLKAAKQKILAKRLSELPRSSGAQLRPQLSGKI